MGLRHMARRCGLSAFLRPRFAALALAGSAIGLAAAEPGCTSGGTGPQAPCPPGETCEVRLTLLHTADIHSRIFPYDLQVLQVDSELGLGTLDEVKNVGGVARVSYVVNRERARADRVLHVDSGDIFEGAPVFNYFQGEPEARAASMMGTDVMVIGNHEFDDGAINVVRQMHEVGRLPAPRGQLCVPVAGHGQRHRASTRSSSPSRSSTSRGSRSASSAWRTSRASARCSSSRTRSASSRSTPSRRRRATWTCCGRWSTSSSSSVTSGLDVDEAMVQGTTGHRRRRGRAQSHRHQPAADPPGLLRGSLEPRIRLGGQPEHPVRPGRTRSTTRRHAAPAPNSVPALLHAAQRPHLPFGRVREVRRPLRPHALERPDARIADGQPGRLRPDQRLRGRLAARTSPTRSTTPSRTTRTSTTCSFRTSASSTRRSTSSCSQGFSPQGASRTAPQGGDSPMGNLISDSMWLRLGVQTDFAMTNTTGIRTDLIPGPVTIEEMFNIFPFNNTITKMQLSGTEVQQMFDFIAGRSQARGCVSQAQIAGARVILNCGGCSRGGLEQRVPTTTTSASAACRAAASTAAETPACRASRARATSRRAPSRSTSGTCPTAGRSNPNCACAQDSDCPDQLQGQCDTSGSDAAAGPASRP